MKKALVIGINDYPGSPLSGCINDVIDIKKMLAKNGDGSANFDIHPQTTVATRAELMSLIRELFAGDGETALFYFSGHGTISGNDGYIVTPDYAEGNEGISTDDLLKLANQSEFKNRVIILDCCNSGKVCCAQPSHSGAPHIAQGVTILAACRGEEGALEINGHGLFTQLMLAALDGGAASIDGEVSPSGIYSYIDRSLGAWDQRPLFATNVTTRVVLRKAKATLEFDVLKDICQLFSSNDHTHSLNPSYEYTNTPDDNHKVIEPYAKQENVAKFKKLQKMERVGLVVPIGAESMYDAAMNSRSCKLTELGKHYWHLVQSGRI